MFYEDSFLTTSGSLDELFNVFLSEMYTLLAVRYSIMYICTNTPLTLNNKVEPRHARCAPHPHCVCYSSYISSPLLISATEPLYSHPLNSASNSYQMEKLILQLIIEIINQISNSQTDNITGMQQWLFVSRQLLILTYKFINLIGWYLLADRMVPLCCSSTAAITYIIQCNNGGCVQIGSIGL